MDHLKSKVTKYKTKKIICKNIIVVLRKTWYPNMVQIDYFNFLYKFYIENSYDKNLSIS